MTLAEELRKMESNSEYDNELTIGISTLTDKLYKSPTHHVCVEFMNDDYSLSNNPSGWYLPWKKKYMEDIIKHFENEGMKILREYRDFGRHIITISI